MDKYSYFIILDIIESIFGLILYNRMTNETFSSIDKHGDIVWSIILLYIFIFISLICLIIFITKNKESKKTIVVALILNIHVIIIVLHFLFMPIIESFI